MENGVARRIVAVTDAAQHHAIRVDPQIEANLVNARRQQQRPAKTVDILRHRRNGIDSCLHMSCVVAGNGGDAHHGRHIWQRLVAVFVSRVTEIRDAVAQRICDVNQLAVVAKIHDFRLPGLRL